MDPGMTFPVAQRNYSIKTIKNYVMMFCHTPGNVFFYPVTLLQHG